MVVPNEEVRRSYHTHALPLPVCCLGQARFLITPETTKNGVMPGVWRAVYLPWARLEAKRERLRLKSIIIF